MKSYLLVAFALLNSITLFGETGFWMKIEELSKHGTPQGNPQLEAYLKNLTQPQMLQAARECCEKAESRIPIEKWEEGVLPVSLALTYYGGQSDTLSDNDLKQILNIISSDNEKQLFRESLVGFLCQKYWPRLTTAQRTECRSFFLRLFLDNKVPLRQRKINGRELQNAIDFEYRQIIYLDKNVRPLRNDKEKWRNLDNLVRKGEIQFTPETYKSLKSIQDEIQCITISLSKLTQDATESPEVKDQIQRALKAFANLPVPPER